MKQLGPRLAAILLALAATTGCAGSRHEARLFALADVYSAHGDFEASALRRLDPVTLHALGRPGLRFGDAVVTRVASPDGRTLAFGGYNFGQVFYVDTSDPTKAQRQAIVPRRAVDDGVEIDVESWPRPDRLIAVATVTGAWSRPHPSQLIVIDPQSRRVVRRTSLNGNVAASVDAGRGTTALLVEKGRYPRVTLVGPTGSTWTTELRRVGLGGTDGVHLGGAYYPPSREPALATTGHGRLFVVAPSRPLAEILVPKRQVRYHTVELTRRYLSYPPPMTPGSGGVKLRFAATAVWLGHDRLAIGGFDELPGWVRGFGVGHRNAERFLQIVDTQRWRVSRSAPVGSCQRWRRLLLCSARNDGYPPDGKGSRGTSLLVYDDHWRRLYVKGPPELWWELTAGRLFAGSPEGTGISELDPKTGRTIRKISPSPLANQTWPLDLVAWPSG